MSYLTPFNVLISLSALLVVIVAILTAWHFSGMGMPEAVTIHEDDIPDQDEIDEDEDAEEYDEDEDDDEDEDEDAEEYDTVTRLARMDHVAILDFQRMKFRAENPRLFADDWYEVSRREFSIEMVKQAQLQAADLQEQRTYLKRYRERLARAA